MLVSCDPAWMMVLWMICFWKHSLAYVQIRLIIGIWFQMKLNKYRKCCRIREVFVYSKWVQNQVKTMNSFNIPIFFLNCHLEATHRTRNTFSRSRTGPLQHTHWLSRTNLQPCCLASRMIPLADLLKGEIGIIYICIFGFLDFLANPFKIYLYWGTNWKWWRIMC